MQYDARQLYWFVVRIDRSFCELRNIRALNSVPKLSL